MKAVVMAGGEGSRLRPLTVGRPKPMVPVLNKPVLEHALGLLKHHRITEVVITLQYLASVIQDYFGDGSDFGVKIHYTVEETPLGTAGSVKNAEALLDDTFIVISGDALTDFPLREIVDFHRSRKALATLTLCRVPNPLEYGVVIIDRDGRIQRFLEKPSWGEVFSDTVNTGIYVLEPAIFRYYGAGRPFDFSQDLFPLLLREGQPLYGFVAEGYWCDVGNLAEYVRANADMLQGRVKLEMPGRALAGEIWLAGEAEISPGAKLYGPIFIGKDCHLHNGVTVYGPAVLGDYTVLETGARVDRSIVGSNSYLGEGASVQGAVVGRQCSLKRHVAVFEGAVIGDNCTLHEGAIVRPEVKIWPEKEVEAGATVGASLIWGARGRKSLFTRSGVTGLANIEITPEFAAKLGAAYGATLPKGAAVTINRDLSRAARMIKRAIISGLPSAGINVVDIEAVPVPVARHETRVSGALGGIHVRLSPFGTEAVDIKLFDPRGLNIDRSMERRIENVFFREDFRRVPPLEIGAIIDAVGVVERYSEAFLKLVNAEVLQQAKLKVVIDFAEGSASQVFSTLLERLGVARVSLNAATGERQRVRSVAEYQEDLRQLALITTTVRANLGIMMNNDGTRIGLVDERGNIVPDFTALAAMGVLALRAGVGRRLVVPVTAPRMLEAVAQQHGGEALRTRAESQALMHAATRDGVALVGDGHGGYLFPQLQSGFDGMMAVAKLLEYLAEQGVALSQVVAGLPSYFLSEADVACPWEYKGQVMRALHERAGPRASVAVEGVRFDLGEEWVLILPDPDRPSFHIYAESRSPEHASALADRFVEMLRGLQS